ISRPRLGLSSQLVKKLATRPASSRLFNNLLNTPGSGTRINTNIFKAAVYKRRVTFSTVGAALFHSEIHGLFAVAAKPHPDLSPQTAQPWPGFRRTTGTPGLTGRSQSRFTACRAHL